MSVLMIHNPDEEDKKCDFKGEYIDMCSILTSTLIKSALHKSQSDDRFFLINIR